jgi:hypothetical protein
MKIGPRLTRWSMVAALLLLICGAILLSYASRLTPHVRQRVVAALEERFDAKVELAAFQVSVFPRPEIRGEGLRVRYKGRTDVPPLISIDAFSASAGLIGLIGSPLRLRDVTLQGLDIRVPAGGMPDVDDETPERTRDAAAAGATDPEKPPPPIEPPQVDPEASSPLVIDRITSMDATFEIAAKRPGKLPRVFEIHDLVLTSFGFDRSASYRADLTNPKPKGRIATEGSFGPWHREDPRMTAVSGTYVFSDADMNTIKGIGGTLTSTGSFAGVLERIAVSGETRTPDFTVDRAGHAVDLRTKFEAVVDGTSGDTWLTPVDAAFLQTTLTAEGAVIRAQEVKGRVVSLAVTIPDGRIEDLLKFAVKSKTPPLTGAVSMTTTFRLPPGENDIADRLHLDGRFELAEARFTNFNVQKRVDTLSRRGRGDTSDSDGASVVSDLKGRFVLRSGVLTFSQLTFSVPGATVRLAGSYTLEGEQLDFRGHLLLDANLSETTSGFKAALAWLAQPLFRREGGGSKLPIKVSGSADKPSFGLDIKRALTPGE